MPNTPTSVTYVYPAAPKTPLGTDVATYPEDSWDEFGRCKEVDPDLFFPEVGDSARGARRICNSCEVKVQCLQYALRTGEKHGVWGGLTPDERRELNRTSRHVA